MVQNAFNSYQDSIIFMSVHDYEGRRLAVFSIPLENQEMQIIKNTYR